MPEAEYRAPPGTHDVLPPESSRWIALVKTFAARATRFGYGLVITPVMEHVEVFQRVGAATDVVSKEMYEFTDWGTRGVALRPEGTAPVVRAYVQHHPTPPWKVWYLAPHFRYERPQKGRYRQHWQVGAEVLGVDDPDGDVEIIALAHGFYRDLGLRRVSLPLNSMGAPEDRATLVPVLGADPSSMGGGAGYDQLAEDMGGPPAPSIGLGIGIERVLIAGDAEGVLLPDPSGLDAFVIGGLGEHDATQDATVLVAELREAGLHADRAYGGRSVKAQWKLADRSGARFGVMLAPKEAARGAVAIKDLATGHQLEVPREQVAGWIRARTAPALEVDGRSRRRCGPTGRDTAV